MEIKKQSDVIDELRRIIDAVDTFQGPDDAVREMVATRITEVGERLRNDAFLKRATRDSLTNMSVDGVMTAGGLGLTAALTHAGFTVGATVTLGAIPVKNFVSKLIDPARRAKRTRGDLLVRVGARLGESFEKPESGT